MTTQSRPTPNDRWEDVIGKQRPIVRPVSAWEHLLALLGPQLCALCNEELSSPIRAICDRCSTSAIDRIRTLSFGEVYSTFEHEAFARRAITGVKFRGERWRGVQLGQHAALYWFSQAQYDVLRSDVLVPIPMSPSKVRQRGFNPALVIASGIQSRVPIRLARGGLRRANDSLSEQKHLNRNERLAIRGRFRAHPRLSGKRIWLVDDVVTTGATLEDAAYALRAVDAKPVGAITITWKR